MEMRLSARVRAAAAELAIFTRNDLICATDLRTYGERNSVSSVFRGMVKSGEIFAAGDGLYRYAGRRQRSYKDVIWHLVRSHRQFTTDEIERLSGANRKTAWEYLRCLEILGLLRNEGRGRQWHLIRDPGPKIPEGFVNCTHVRRAALARARKGAAWT